MSSSSNKSSDRDKKTVRVVVAEDYGGLSKILRRVIDEAPDMTCSGCFNNGRELLESLEKLRPDVISLDLSMPEMNGFAVLKQLRKTAPDVRCIVFSGFAEEDYVRGALAAGAEGYVFKEDFGEFTQGITEVAAGCRYLSSRFEGMRDLPDHSLGE